MCHEQGRRGGRYLSLKNMRRASAPKRRRQRANAEPIYSSSIGDQPEGRRPSNSSNRFSHALLFCNARFTGGSRRMSASRWQPERV